MQLTPTPNTPPTKCSFPITPDTPLKPLKTQLKLPLNTPLTHQKLSTNTPLQDSRCENCKKSFQKKEDQKQSYLTNSQTATVSMPV